MEFTLAGQKITPERRQCPCAEMLEGCARVQTLIPTILREHGSKTTVCTIGSVLLTPGSPNVVPGQCVFTVEVRDERPDIVAAVSTVMQESVRSVAAELGLDVSQERLMSMMEPVAADPKIMASIRRHCTRVLEEDSTKSTALSVRTMPSGAAHARSRWES